MISWAAKKKDDKRTHLANKNILLSLMVKGISIIATLFLVPITLDYLNPYEYGIWITLSSILLWINYFDIGLGNGLRNRLVEAFSLNNNKLARTYISTSFVIIFLIVAVFIILFLISFFVLDWHAILNVENGQISNINQLVAIVFILFGVSFGLKLVGIVFIALQKPAINDSFIMLGHLLSLAFIYIISKLTTGSLLFVAVAYSLAPLLVYIIAYIVTFYFKYKHLKPSLKLVNFSYGKDLLGLGVKFFLIQIVCLIVFSTSNLLISHILNPSFVTPYNVAFRYFSVATMLFSIIAAPLWSAITDAYSKNEVDWISTAVKRMLKVWGGSVIVVAIMFFMSKLAFKLWIGPEFQVSDSLLMFIGIYIIIGNWNQIFASFSNGTGFVMIQLITAIFSGIIFIPLAIILGKIYGINGIVGAMSISLIPSAIWLPLQYKSVMKGTAKGIYLK